MLTPKAREVLEALQREGLLDGLILIGSWCAYFYESYFRKGSFEAGIKTLDMDFLVPKPRMLGKEAKSVKAVLEPLDFDPDFTVSGWERFVHPHLRVEFLVPRMGPTSDEPRLIKELGVIAQPLRHTSVLVENVITIRRDKLCVNVPHPIAFALHKLFVSTRRKEKGKRARDIELAFRVLEAAERSGSVKDVPAIWKSFTEKERKAIRGVFASGDRTELLSALGLDATA